MKLYKKITCAVLALLILCLTGCDLFGGADKADVNLYHLTFSFSSNVASNEQFKKEDIIATYAAGERHEFHTRPQDEIDQLLEDGASQADIDKSTVKQADGSYYFFSGDPMTITPPEVEGYMFVGFYDKKDNSLYRPLISEFTMEDGSKEMLMSRWNMPERDTELEVRYQPLEYSISYCYAFDTSSGPTGESLPSGLFPSGAHTNPARFDSTLTNFELSAPTQEFAGYEFKYWFYYEQGTGRQIIVETLPKTYEDDVLHGTYDAESISNCNLTLFAHYEIKSYTVTATVDEGVTLTATDQYDSSITYDITGKTITVEAGTRIHIYVDSSEIDIIFPEFDHVFEGIYINGVKEADLDLGGGLTRPTNVCDIEVMENIEIEVKVAVNSEN